MTVEPGTAVMFQIDFAVFFYMQSTPHVFFAGIELQHVA